MVSRQSQRGLSIWSTILVVICLTFAGLIGLKLVPVYLESMKIDRGLAGLLENNDVSQMSKAQIKDGLLRQLDIDSVTEIQYSNFWDVVSMEKDGDSVTLNVAYEVVVPIAGNVSALINIQKSVQNDN